MITLLETQTHVQGTNKQTNTITINKHSQVLKGLLMDAENEGQLIKTHSTHNCLNIFLKREFTHI